MNLNKNKRRSGVLVLLSLIIISLFAQILFFSNLIPININVNKDLNSPKQAQWNLTGSHIVINDSIPTKSWAYTASHYPWCSGSGVWSDPYLIHDVEIDGEEGESCIIIAESTVFFRIENCRLYNSGWTEYDSAGIRLIDTDNGFLIGNNCSFNEYNGINIEFGCNNNTLTGNTVTNNQDGIKVQYSANNTIIGNSLVLNSVRGINVQDSDNVIIKSNTLSNNRNGIWIDKCENCTATGNLLANCGFIISGNLYNMKEFTSITIGSTNYVNGKSVYYYVNQKGLRNSDFVNPGQIMLVNCSDSAISNFVIPHASNGISLTLCRNITLFNNDLSYNNVQGIHVEESSYVNLTNNKANNCKYEYTWDTIGKGIYMVDCSNCIIVGNTASDNTDAGIYIWKGDNCTFHGNTMNSNQRGFRLSDSNDIIVSGNILNDNYNGITLYDCYEHDLIGNIIDNCQYYGIYIEQDSANITLSGNQLSNTGVYLDSQGTLKYLTSQEIDITNLANGKPIYYYANQSGLLSTDFTNAGQIILVNVQNSVMDDLQIYNTSNAITMIYCDGNTISNCDFKYNRMNALEMWYSNNTVIKSNTVDNNFETGFYLIQSHYNNITDNTLTDDPVNNPHAGIRMDTCNHNFISKNHIFDCMAGLELHGEYNTISDNNVSSNVDEGIRLEHYGNNIIENNIVNDNEHGIMLSESDFNDILNNMINYSRGYGIEFWDSDYNNITGNTFYCNRDGCWREENSIGNIFTDNICELCPEEPTDGGRPPIPSYNVLFILGIISVSTILLTRKKLKKLKN
ncbi:MAG: NosD domain-containing protein [Promethearchaeota archaeon]